MDNTEAIAVLQCMVLQRDLHLSPRQHKAISFTMEALKENETLKAEQDRLHKSIIQIACAGSDELTKNPLVGLDTSSGAIKELGAFKTVPELTVAQLYKRAIEAENKPLPTLEKITDTIADGFENKLIIINGRQHLIQKKCYRDIATAILDLLKGGNEMREKEGQLNPCLRFIDIPYWGWAKGRVSAYPIQMRRCIPIPKIVFMILKLLPIWSRKTPNCLYK